MQLRTILTYCFALFIVVGFVSAVLAGGGLPEPLASELTQYPGSRVLNASSLPGNNYIANMNFGKDSVSKVYEYYKAKMMENGFTIQAEVGGTSIIGKKGNMDAVVDLDTQNGMTVGTLSLTGGSDTKASVEDAPPPPTSADTESGDVSMGMPGSQADYPDDLGNIVKQYPGSMVMTSMNNSNDINAMLTKPDCSVAEVAAYYKKEMSKAGWEIEGEMTQPERLLLEYKKSGRQFIVNVSGVKDAVIIILALRK